MMMLLRWSFAAIDLFLLGGNELRIPVLALRNLTVLPKLLLHFDINRPRSIAAVEKAMAGDQKLFLVTQMDASVEEPEQEDLFTYGTIGSIKQLVKLPDGLVRVLVEGETRASLVRFTFTDPYYEGEVKEEPVREDLPAPAEAEAMLRVLRRAIVEYCKVVPGFSENNVNQLTMIGDLWTMVEQAMIRLPLPTEARQDMLDQCSAFGQYQILMGALSSETAVGRLMADIQKKVKDQLDENQKSYVLHEQMKAIRGELGEDEADEAECFEELCYELEVDEEIREKILKEIRHFANTPSGNQEGAVLRTYIETLLELPWNRLSEDRIDLEWAEEILEKDHYGMEKVKERVLEYLAVRTFTGEAGGSILCLVGPPGTGKTSIASSIARALNKKYVRVCLGGVRDEAEIRGHRRTYIGAMPGRIATGLKQAGVANPVMLLDEIDKVSSDYKGDTSSALLEVLDSEQNCHFRDHYVELPLDLSHVLFIATANTTDPIPRPLLDRMEVIEVSGYTENEKFHIAKNYLVRKQRKANGLTASQVVFTEGALKKIIHNYTREAGVRNLERKIGAVCRKCARELLQTGKNQIRITEKNLGKYLGRELEPDRESEKEDLVGIVTGLAWTSVGGDTLEVEVNTMAGDGGIQLTGQLGDVMKESAQAGISYVRSIADRYSIAGDYFDKHDVHLHIPEGAVPKDGPSAGITMATAVLSAVTGKKVRSDLAMTGDITLRGRVLPVGGLKEKLLAANMAGIRRVLVPGKNRPDIEELSAEITGDMEICYVDSMEDVIPLSCVEEAHGNQICRT